MADASGRITLYRETMIEGINWIGFWTLYTKEVRRFCKVYTQTLLAPISTAVLYLIVFVTARGGTSINGTAYGAFLAPGLIMMSMTQNAFANSSSSITISKVQGNIVDLLLPPLSAAESVAALALGGMTRGLVVGLAVLLPVALLTPVHMPHPLVILYFGVSASLLFSTLGVIGGLWADKFDQMAAVTNFVVMPLSFLSGTFYSVKALPLSVRAFVDYNPVFYAIDGFRYGFIDKADAPLLQGAICLAILNALLLLGAWRLFVSGYKLKA